MRAFLGALLLTTCSTESALEPRRTVHSVLDASAFFQANEFAIPVDEVVLEIRRVSDNSLAFSETLTAEDYTQSGGQLTIQITLDLLSSPEDFDFLAIVRSGGVEYYRATGRVTAEVGRAVQTPPISPTYTGPGATADLLTIPSATVLTNGQTATLTGVVSLSGTPIGGVPVSFSSSDSGLLIPQSTGINQASVTGPVSGSGSVVITARTPSGLTATGTVSWAPATVATLVKVSGDAQSVVAGAAAPAPLVVRVQDGQTPVAGTQVTFAVTAGPTGTFVAPTTVTTDGQGLAQTVLTAGNVVGPINVTASAPGTGSPQTFTATAVSGPAAALAFAVQPTSVVSGAPITPAVQVTIGDALGNVVTSSTAAVTLAIGANPGSATLGGTTTVAAVNGVATFANLTLNQSGIGYTLAASSPALAGATSTTFNVTSTAASVVIVSGDNQTGPASSALGQPLVVEVRDAGGAPVAGVTVAWATSNGGSLAPTSAITNAQGRAQTTWTLGPSAPTQTTTATVGALPAATFTATVGQPSIALAFTGVPGVGIGLTAGVSVTLAQPAPVNGTTVSLGSGNPAIFTVPASIVIGQGLTTGTTVVTGVSAGTATLTASAAGHTDGTLSVAVQNRNISVPVTLNVPYGQTAQLPIQLPAPAPAGGVTFDVSSSNPALVSVSTPTVTIAAGTQTANATLSGVLPGPATITVANVAYVSGATTATTSASLDIVQTSVNPNASFGTPITINFVSNGVATAAPAPGISVDLVPANPACVSATTPVTIPTGLVSTTATLSYGGTASLPCTSRVYAQATNLLQDSVTVTVSALPTISVGALTVGSGLQDNSSFTLGAANHGNITVTLTSSDPAVLLSPNATTAGTSQITIPVLDGVQSVGFYVQGLEGRVADTVLSTVTVSAPGFSDGSATMTAVQGAIDLQGLPGTTTTLSPSSIVYARLGLPQASNAGLQALQNLRAGSTLAPLTVSFTTPATGIGELLKAATAPGTSQTALIPLAVNNTPTDTTSGGVVFHPLLSGATTVSASTPGFIATTAATRSVTVSQPTISVGALTVGSGLQDNTSFTLGAPNHGGVNVTLTSSNAAVLLSPNATTAGTSQITIPVANGTQSVGFYVQGLEGRVADTVLSTVTVSAPGFSDGSATMTAVQGAIDLQGLPGTTTTLSPSSIVYARLGLPQAGNGALQALQNMRAGSTLAPLTVSFTTPSNGIGELRKVATAAGTTQTALIPLAVNNTPTDSASGAIVFHALLSGTTTVSASTPDFIATTAATRSITASQPSISVGALTVGSGLQDNSSFTLGAPNHGGVNVTLTSSNAAVLLSPNATTAGTSQITIPVANGTQSVGFYVQGLEGQTGSVTATITVSAAGFTDGTAAMTVVQPALDLQGLPGTTTPLSAGNIVYARIGIPQAGNGALQALQNMRAGSTLAPLTATFSTPANGIGELLKAGSAAGTTQTAVIVLTANNTPTDTTAGGVMFHPLAGLGTTTVSATIPGFIATTAATRSITSSQPTISVGSVTVGSGLQDNTSFTLGAPNHGGVNVTLTSSDPAILLSPNATTAGASQITVPVANGTQTVGFYVQGLEGRTTGLTGTVSVSAAGFSNGVANQTVLQAALDLQGVPSTMAVGAADASFYARVGTTTSPGNAALNQTQAVRAGIPGGALSVTFTSSNTAAATLVNSTGGTGSPQTLLILSGLSNTTTSIAAGGVGVRRVAAGTASISASIPSVITTAAGTRAVTVQ